MSRHRDGELGAVPFRSGRFFYIEHQWYFSCREGRDQGPFNNRESAESALYKYIEKIADYPATNYTTPASELLPSTD